MESGVSVRKMRRRQVLFRFRKNIVDPATPQSSFCSSQMNDLGCRRRWRAPASKGRGRSSRSCDHGIHATLWLIQKLLWASVAFRWHTTVFFLSWSWLWSSRPVDARGSHPAVAPSARSLHLSLAIKSGPYSSPRRPPPNTLGARLSAHRLSAWSYPALASFVSLA